VQLDAAGDAVSRARRIAADKLQQQAAQVGAEFVVGSDIKIDVREVPCGFGGCPLDDLDVDVSWFGTGIRRIPSHAGQRAHAMPPLILSMIPLGRRRDALIDAEDDADDVEIAAEEAQEMALEADEAADDAG
jgi:hypothetical protein